MLDGPDRRAGPRRGADPACRGEEARVTTHAATRAIDAARAHMDVLVSATYPEGLDAGPFGLLAGAQDPADLVARRVQRHCRPLDRAPEPGYGEDRCTAPMIRRAGPWGRPRNHYGYLPDWATRQQTWIVACTGHGDWWHAQRAENQAARPTHRRCPPRTTSVSSPSLPRTSPNCGGRGVDLGYRRHAGRAPAGEAAAATHAHAVPG